MSRVYRLIYQTSNDDPARIVTAFATATSEANRSCTVPFAEGRMMPSMTSRLLPVLTLELDGVPASAVDCAFCHSAAALPVPLRPTRVMYARCVAAGAVSEARTPVVVALTLCSNSA